MADTENQWRPLPPPRAPARDGAELARERAATSLRAELAGLRDLMETMCGGMTDGVVLIDAERRVQHLNKAAEEILGVGPVSVGTPVETVLRDRQKPKALRRWSTAAPIRWPSVGDDLQPARQPLRAQSAGPSLWRDYLPPGGRGRTLGIFRDITALKQRQAGFQRKRATIWHSPIV